MIVMFSEVEINQEFFVNRQAFDAFGGEWYVKTDHDAAKVRDYRFAEEEHFDSHESVEVDYCKN